MRNINTVVASTSAEYAVTYTTVMGLSMDIRDPRDTGVTGNMYSFVITIRLRRKD